MSKTTSIILAILILGSALYYVNRDTRGSVNTTGNIPGTTARSTAVPNSEIKDGMQYVNILVNGGYTPKISLAKADVQTKLVMKTNGAYDCSTSLVIKSLGYRKYLPSTGETVIDAGTYKKGETLQGVCSMGMYSFVVEFE